MDYLKYYWLENEFFPEIRKSFEERHYLTPEQLFSIVVWKSSRPKKLIWRGLLVEGQSLYDTVKSLTKRIYNTEKNDQKLKLKILLDQPGFQLAMASAVLTVLYPNDFTLYDWRVCGQLKDPKNGKRKYPDITYAPNGIDRYFNRPVP